MNKTTINSSLKKSGKVRKFGSRKLKTISNAYKSKLSFNYERDSKGIKLFRHLE